jgi:alpha-beta hydrolase superfamily lysophospholipase
MGTHTNVRDGRRWKCYFSKAFISAIGIVSLIGFGVTGGLWFIAYLALHPPTRTTGETPADPPSQDYRDVSFATDDGLVLKGWYLPRRSGATVILVHGFARDRTELLPEARWLVEKGYSALLFDTRAQGSSEGTHISMGYLEALDVRAAIEFVRGQSPQERIGIIGYSMGAVAAIQAAAKDTRIQAMIAVSPFATLRDTVRHHLNHACLLAPLVIWLGERMAGLDVDNVRPVDVVSALAPRPILIMQAGDDGMVPTDSGQRLVDAAAEPKELWSVPGVAHVDFRQAVPEAYKRRVIGFFEQYLPLDD